ncbi:MAG: tetratricopeptide repeat protein [Chloroflexi bacterium]|nr:tetratricopeptide repeat protein [Chloroflexota bacterium]
MAFMAKQRAQAHYNAGSMIFLDKSPSPKALRKAIEHLQKATKLDPSFAFAFHNLAHAWYMVSEGTITAARRSDLQIEAYNEKERCKDHSDVEDFITSVLECALNAVDQALTISYEFPQAHNTRAMILAKLGRLDEAIEATEVALSQDPDYKNASENREKIKELRRNAPKF